MERRSRDTTSIVAALLGGLLGALVGSLADAAVGDHLVEVLAPCLGTDMIASACPKSELIKIGAAALGIVFVGCAAGAVLGVRLARSGRPAAMGLAALGVYALALALVANAAGLGLPEWRALAEPAIVVWAALSLLGLLAAGIVRRRHRARAGP